MIRKKINSVNGFVVKKIRYSTHTLINKARAALTLQGKPTTICDFIDNAVKREIKAKNLL